MKKIIVTLFVLSVAWSWSYADFAGSGFSSPGSGGSATTDASLLTSGILPAARIGDNSITGTKIQDNAVNLRNIRFTTAAGYTIQAAGNTNRVRLQHYLDDGTALGVQYKED